MKVISLLKAQLMVKQIKSASQAALHQMPAVKSHQVSPFENTASKIEWSPNLTNNYNKLNTVYKEYIASPYQRSSGEPENSPVLSDVFKPFSHLSGNSASFP